MKNDSATEKLVPPMQEKAFLSGNKLGEKAVPLDRKGALLTRIVLTRE
jgi:hypothetical protein